MSGPHKLLNPFIGDVCDGKLFDEHPIFGEYAQDEKRWAQKSSHNARLLLLAISRMELMNYLLVSAALELLSIPVLQYTLSETNLYCNLVC